jgi:outer membrane protein OmpA-like peptidoglycan-associated protein/osmotically-inducible protein OsmY
MKKVLLALLGLILLAILGFFCFQDKADSIRQDLVSSTNQALSSNDLSGVQAVLKGEGVEMTDIIKLTGEVPTNEAKAKAESIARSIMGVGGVDNQLHIAQKTALSQEEKQEAPTKPIPVPKETTPYTLTITKDEDGKVTLDGFVASEEKEKALLTQAEKIYSADNVTNNLKVKADAPEDWEHISSFALERLKDVDYGDMKLHDQSYEFTGHLSSPSKKADFLDGIRQVMSDPENKYGRYRGDYIITAPIEEPVIVKKEEPTKEKVATAVVKPDVQTMTVASCQSLLDGLLSTKKVLFDYNKASIKKGSYALLDSIAETLQDCRASHVEIGGHTDNIGRESYNQRLSQKRALNVKQYLIQKGISPDSLSAIGHGETQPIASNKTAQSRAKNRRIEFIVKEVK